MFKKLTDQLSKTARSIQDQAEMLAAGGWGFLQDSLGRIPFFTATQVFEFNASCEADETHYFLVPFRGVEDGYALHALRALPVGTGLENDLPRLRIFHLPDSAAREKLESLLRASLSAQVLAEMPEGSDLADRLEKMADAMDEQTSKVTGGLLIIGGIVAVANPLLGVGIAAKALLPSLASSAGGSALGYLTDKLRQREQNQRTEEAAKEATQAVKGLKPEIYENPLLRLLETAVSTADTTHDPFAEELEIAPTLAWMRMRKLTASAISDCYRSILDDRKACGAAALHDVDVGWLRALVTESDAARTHPAGMSVLPVQ